MTTSIKITYFIFFLLFLSYPRCHASQDSLTTHETIKDGNHDTLISPGKIFQMGFFRTQNRNRRYLGIWYHGDSTTIVWVANRDNPITSSSTIVTIEADGNIVVQDKSRKYFTTGLPTASVSVKRTMKLLDSGNLVLQDESGKHIWSSFDFPTDTFLPGMYMEMAMKLTSWKSQHDPRTGGFVFSRDTYLRYNNYTIRAGKRIHWKSGFGLRNINPTNMPIDALQLLSKANSTKPLTNSRLLMSSTGEIQFYYWDLTSKRWALNWSEPKDYCSRYNACGPNNSCNISETNTNSLCKCLPGFETNEKSCKSPATIICNDNDTIFIDLEILKIDVNLQTIFLESGSAPECKENCLNYEYCCQAYSYNGVENQELVLAGVLGGKQGCWIWTSGVQLVDIQVGYGVSGRNLSIRKPGSTGSKAKRSTPVSHKLIIISAIVITGVLLLCCCIVIFCCKRKSNTDTVQGNAESESVYQFNESVRQIQESLDPFRTDDNSQGIGIQFFNFDRISESTDGFSEGNKLGKGGFGTVYKGKLPGGLEVAVKRLSINSGQGSEEFKNEVTLIARLQHRNLVRLLGYCIKGHEKMLIYEFMPNGSLDSFIFDETRIALLKWSKRFEIILGICRGLIYLHQDSRLRIIHGDLKTNNVLLDEDLNPKISDFGLAKIINGEEEESGTKRIIGTYGYMAPEYALEGLCSVKSDVYSFGVVILEIVSGIKKHFQNDQLISLANYAWQLYKDGRPLEMMEQTLTDSYDSDEVLKCITVGLLCVQDDPDDRPNMFNVVTMLTSDIDTLPQPKKPAFVVRKQPSCYASSSSYPPPTQTQVDVTLSTIQGRP